MSHPNESNEPGWSSRTTSSPFPSRTTTQCSAYLPAKDTIQDDHDSEAPLERDLRQGLENLDLVPHEAGPEPTDPETALVDRDREPPRGEDATATNHPSPTSTVYCPETTRSSDAMPRGEGSRDVEKQEPNPEERMNVGGDDEVVHDNENTDEDRWTVKWEGADDPGDPLNTSSWKKWVMTFVLAVSCACATCCSSMASDTYGGLKKDFGVGQEVCVLTISLFVAGLGVGPLFLGPVSEFLGRARVLHYSFATFFLLNFPVAFANNIAVHLIFRFLTGFAGSAFLSVSGGAISDVFPNAKLGTPMMIFSAAPFIGPVLGPLVSGFINENTYWRWTYYVIIIWAAVMLVLLLVFVPESYSPELLRRKAERLRKVTGDERWIAPVEKLNRTFWEALKKSIKTPFILLSTQYMVLFLDLWSALILGILYLFFGGVQYVFRIQHGFTLQQTGLSFLGIGFGQVVAVACQPYFNKIYHAEVKKHGGAAPPEARLVAGKWGALLCPLGILLFGLTSFRNVHWIVPIIMSSFFGAGMVFSFTSTFTYLVDAYRPVAASALASNSFLRSAFAAGFPLFGQQMYARLGAVGGSCLLGGLMCLTVPLPFLFYKIGARVRARSNFAASG